LFALLINDLLLSVVRINYDHFSIKALFEVSFLFLSAWLITKIIKILYLYRYIDAEGFIYGCILAGAMD